MLLVIDDIWDIKDVLPFQSGGLHCSYLFTTRFPHLARHFAVNDAFLVNELNEEDGIRVLHHFVPDLLTSDAATLYSLVRSVGGLPLALMLIGKYLRVQAHSRQPRRIRAAFTLLEDSKECLKLSEPYALVERHSSLPQGTPLSLEALIAVSDQRLSVQARDTLRTLSLFPPKPNSFVREAALAVSQQQPAVFTELLNSGLLERHTTDRYALHRIIADYAQLYFEKSEATQRFVNYFVNYVQEYEKDHAALEKERENILAALRLAYECGMGEKLVAGVTAFLPFLLARKDAVVDEVRLWLRSYQDPGEN